MEAELNNPAIKHLKLSVIKYSFQNFNTKKFKDQESNKEPGELAHSCINLPLNQWDCQPESLSIDQMLKRRTVHALFTALKQTL